MPALEQPGNCELEIRSQKVRYVFAGGRIRSGELPEAQEGGRPCAPLPPPHPDVLRTLNRSRACVPFSSTVRKHESREEAESKPGRQR